MSDWKYDPDRDNFLQAFSKIGLPNSSPDDGILQNALDWQKLKSLSKKERNTQIVKRANLFLYYAYPPLGLGDYLARKRDAEAQAEKGNYQEDTTSFVARFPLEKLQELFPIAGDPVHSINEDRSIGCISSYPSLAIVQERFDETRKHFRTGKLYQRIVELVERLFRTKTQINKIVAFGGGGFLTPWGPCSGTSMWHTQHAILLVMREVWQKVNPKSGRLPIFLQDISYSRFDEQVAKHYDMQIVNGSIAHQMGWTLLDESTFLVDLKTNFPLIRLAFEITRPAAMLVPHRLNINLDASKPYFLTLKHGGKEVKIPTPGPYDAAKAFECIETEYQRETLNVNGMDGTSFGADANSVQGRYGVDGEFGDDQHFPGFCCYLGMTPTLYTRL